MTTTHKTWHKIIKRHNDCRAKMIELNLKIEEGMKEYLKTVGETEDFIIRFEETGTIKLNCNGDLFNLEQIFDFCDVFNLSLIINNRVIVENHLKNTTEIRTNYLFTTGKLEEKTTDSGD
ncbi:hypothetical protein [uncultured Methanobrevibacter sp.]|uniref:hypothetical protein n=1 Tax=uncultured Methanobrevibacter sp. TaxID=253161 RepID=UPI0025FC0C77|nr:hypothetical protein [uncultured Methanobrevibacter sp.]